jgi:outer membrane protein
LGLPAVLAFALSAAAAPAYGLDPYITRSIDPFDTERNVSPAPHLRWEPNLTLPEVKEPPRGRPPATAQPLSLAELTEFALRNNPRTRQAWFAARAAAAGVGVEKSDDLPTITGGYAVNRSQQTSNTSGALVPWQTRWGPSISLTYMLYDFGYGDSLIEAAEYRSLAASLSHNRVLQDVVFQVEQAYYLVLGIDALVRVNEQFLKNTQTAHEITQRRRESGLATVADVYRTETQIAQAQLNLTRSRGDLEKARGQLAVAVGMPVGGTLNIQTFSGPPQIGEIAASLNSLLDRAKAGRPDLVAAEAQARAARANARAASRANWPTIELAGTTGHSMFNDNRVAVSNYAIGVAVRIPIFTGFRSTYSTRAAEAQAEQAEAARDNLYQQTELDVWQSYYDLQTAASATSSTELQVKSSEQTAAATLARYQAGFGSILDLVTAQVDESNARVQRIQSYLNWFTALARLNLSIGSSGILTTAGPKQ